MDPVTRAIRKRILRERLAVALARRDKIEARLRVLRERDSKRMTAAVKESLSNFERASRTAR